ncbi:hypothetical protein [Escherichia coli]|uniref:hypothetical protein n=1 Tax=Escherichia coli TaxID=562 RepID=UPI0010EA43AD|nr:hypothetical protein [Escherichia coli]GDA53395.1 hypothetical protein HmCmsJML164_03857 [Escherichia coli]
MSNRDDFSPSVKRTLAERVGWKCSYLGCNQTTVGPDSSNTNGRINNGIAAHITAAAPGGPRYDHSLTPEQRSSIDNGIWMCRSHAALIDSDKYAYSVEQLKNWKTLAETQQSLLLQMAHQVSQNNYSERDVDVLKAITDIFNYNYLQMLKSEQFRAKVSTQITDPLDSFGYITRDPFYSFNDIALEKIRIELVEKVSNFWKVFREHSAGGLGYYDYIDISHIRLYYPDQVERFYDIINQTQDLAYEISITAHKLLEIRAKL